jgi:tRNA U55 pseudouridine synthase TruB
VHEIAIPIKQSHIYKITYNGLRTVAREEIVRTVDAKIATIPEVTDPRKALGADFRRDAVRAGWQTFAKDGAPDYQVLTFTCICSSGTYMRSLAEYLGKELGMAALAYSIHRTKIGRFQGLFDGLGVWTKRL